jgi:hypothetical protein
VTSDISVCNAAIMPAGYGIGDHHLLVIDFSTADMIGMSCPMVVKSASRRLNTKIPSVATEYVRILEEKVSHWLIKHMGAAHRKSRSRALATVHFNRLDRELGQYMRYAEKKCRKIKSGPILFSPIVSLWIGHTQFYRSLLKIHA